MTSRRRALTTLLLSAVLVTGGTVGVSTPAQAESSAIIFGRVTDSSTHTPVRTFKVTLFDKNFAYVKQVRVNKNGVYQIPSPGAGRYHLQFVDNRPAYDTNAYAARLNVPIKVGTKSLQKSITVHRGGSIGGTILAKGRRASNATIRAVSDHGQVLNVTANSKGQYALGGLANDNYRVFSYDRAKRWVGKSRLVRNVKAGRFTTASFNLKTRPSSFTGFLTMGGKPRKSSVTVTVVNKYTGEYWVQRVKNGDLYLSGLTAGSYKLEVPNTNGYFGRTFNLGKLKTGQARSASANLPIKGGYFVGTVVDMKTKAPLKNVGVRLIDANGKTQAEVPTKADGTFRLGGYVVAQSNVTIKFVTYGKIDGVAYLRKEIHDYAIRNNHAVNLGQNRLEQVPPPTPTPATTTTAPTPTPATTTTAPTPSPATTTPTPAPATTTPTPPVP